LEAQIDSTQESGPADSLTDEITAAFDSYDEVETPDNEATAASPDVDNPDVGDTDTSSDASNSDEVNTKPADEETQAAEVSTVETSAPEHWSQTDKDVFNNSPPELKDWLLARHKSMEADYTKKTTSISDFKRDYEPVQALLEPYRANLAQMGVTPAQYVERLAQADNMLNQNPMQGLKQIAQMYNIDLSQLGQPAEGSESIDPEVQSLRDEINALKGSVTQRQQAEQQERQNTILSEIQTFAEAKDENGELAHPYFEEAMNDIMALAQAERQLGRNPVLNDLYDKAVWSNTSIREQMQAATTAAQAKRATEEARAKAAQAKQAGKSVTGSPSGNSPSADLSLREQLSSQF
jgi:hypothetical protein